MGYRKRIFIGSSTESVHLGHRIVAALEPAGYDCRLWNGDFFEYGHSYMEDLVKKIISYDYAIMIGGPDDDVLRKSTGTHKTAPRDNIYLEYGLFSGVLSPRRTLLLLHRDCCVASDLAGISLADFVDEAQAVEKVLHWMAQREGGTPGFLAREHIELLPTVGIAVGYYENFLLPFFQKFSGDDFTEHYDSIHLTICVPSFISREAADYKKLLRRKYRLQAETVIEKYRIMTRPAEPGVLEMFDVPSTVQALFKTVDYIWGIETGNTDDMEHAKLRALDNFADNICTLVSGNRLMKEYVDVVRFEE